MRLKDKVAIVTGASSGIGEAIAKTFLNQGAKVVFSDINDYQIDNNKAFFFKADVSKKQEVEDLINFTIDKFSKIDILVNNAGIGLTGELTEMSDDVWEKVIDINLNGTFYASRLVTKHMKDNSIKGSVINISSILGQVGFRTASAYCASKGAVNQLTKASALELAPLGIRINAIAPGFIKTNMTKGIQDNEEANNAVVSAIPMGHMGEVDDIAMAALYLASDESKFVTGSIIYVDGGWIAQ